MFPPFRERLNESKICFFFIFLTGDNRGKKQTNQRALSFKQFVNVKNSKIQSLLKSAGIKRNKRAILSKAKIERVRKGRAPLTKDLLFKLYVTDEKTITEIGAELNYSPSTITFNLKRFGIRARKTGRKRNFKLQKFLFAEN